MASRFRRRAIEEWRGLPGAPEAPDRLFKAGEVAATWLTALGASEGLTEADARAAWREIVGDFLAQHSAPARFKAGVLYVQVLQPTVHYELDRVWKGEVLKKLQERFGAKRIRGVRFFVG